MSRKISSYPKSASSSRLPLFSRFFWLQRRGRGQAAGLRARPFACGRRRVLRNESLNLIAAPRQCCCMKCDAFFETSFCWRGIEAAAQSQREVTGWHRPARCGALRGSRHGGADCLCLSFDTGAHSPRVATCPGTSETWYHMLIFGMPPLHLTNPTC